jgi:hypothetical protein
MGYVPSGRYFLVTIFLHHNSLTAITDLERDGAPAYSIFLPLIRHNLHIRIVHP